MKIRLLRFVCRCGSWECGTTRTLSQSNNWRASAVKCWRSRKLYFSPLLSRNIGPRQSRYSEAMLLSLSYLGAYIFESPIKIVCTIIACRNCTRYLIKNVWNNTFSIYGCPSLDTRPPRTKCGQLACRHQTSQSPCQAVCQPVVTRGRNQFSTVRKYNPP